MKREVWFEKILWSYMPCHWKGWALIALVAIVTMPTVFAAQAVFFALGWQGASDLPFLLIFPAVFWLSSVAKRHS